MTALPLGTLLGFLDWQLKMGNSVVPLLCNLALIHWFWVFQENRIANCVVQHNLWCRINLKRNGLRGWLSLCLLDWGQEWLFPHRSIVIILQGSLQPYTKVSSPKCLSLSRCFHYCGFGTLPITFLGSTWLHSPSRSSLPYFLQASYSSTLWGQIMVVLPPMPYYFHANHLHVGGIATFGFVSCFFFLVIACWQYNSVFWKHQHDALGTYQIHQASSSTIKINIFMLVSMRRHQSIRMHTQQLGLGIFSAN